MSIISAREDVPFPSIIEILMMEVAFELIREGGIRIPGVIGQTLGIIGALILGQAAVAAGFVSPALIIIVAVSGLGSFCIPNISLSLAIRIIRFIFIFLGASLGFYGISIGITIIGAIACNMKSFGVPFFSPVAPKTNANPDIVIRQPIWKQKMRPDYLNTPDRKRSGDNPIKWKNKRGEQ
jgi:spore germination protein KA